ncbi:IS3 family transposase [Spiroplasma gladiatoris]|uniref:IS3 family transposase n=1 Tax=Spiroplasma gladiatoris TaxID=2143 RepID=UPI003C7E421E
MNLAYKIKDIFMKRNGVYGVPRIKIILNNKGVMVSKTKIDKIIKIFNCIQL